MAEARIERRLAAVLAADVAGYSRLMGTNEVGTLAALKALRRDVFDPAIAAHHGRIVKTTGDGMLGVRERGRCRDLRGCGSAENGGANHRRAEYPVPGRDQHWRHPHRRRRHLW